MNKEEIEIPGASLLCEGCQHSARKIGLPNYCSDGVNVIKVTLGEAACFKQKQDRIPRGKKESGDK